MSEIEHAEGFSALAKLFFHALHAFEGDVPIDVIDRHGGMLDDFYDVVAEPMVKFAFRMAEFGKALLGEGRGKAFLHQATAIAQKMIDDGEEEIVRKEIVDAPRNERAGVPQAKDEAVCKFFHVCLVALRLF